MINGTHLLNSIQASEAGLTLAELLTLQPAIARRTAQRLIALMPKFTLEERIEMSLQRSPAKVFLRKDFNKFGGYDQVGRALRSVVNKGLVIKAGFGVYVQAKKSSLLASLYQLYLL